MPPSSSSQIRAIPGGLLNINKPGAWTSRKVVDRVRAFVRPARVGHAGTLDPLATGVLVICIGVATRLTEYIHQQPKSYRARFRLGVRSDTDDITGDVVQIPDAARVSRSQLEAILPEFCGTIQQVPPRYSAVHVQGRRSYALARQGIEAELAPRPVEVFRLSLLDMNETEFELDIECGSGTYVRSLGRDLAARLGSSAAMSQLVRTRVGPFHLQGAADIESLHRDTIGSAMLPIAMAVDHLPKRVLNPDDAQFIVNGRVISCASATEYEESQHVALLNAESDMLAVAEFQNPDARLVPRKVFMDAVSGEPESPNSVRD